MFFLPGTAVIDLAEQIAPQLHHGIMHSGIHADFLFPFTMPYHIGNHGINPVAMGGTQHPDCFCRQILRSDDSRTDGIINIMVHIGNAVRKMDNPSLRCSGMLLTGMTGNAVPHFLCQVESGTIPFQTVCHPQALIIVPEPADGFTQPIQCPFSGMSEGCMPQIMSQCNGFGQILIQPQASGHGTGNLRHLQHGNDPPPGK